MPSSTIAAPLWGILLAAGQGRRYAQQQPGADKLQATLDDGRTLLQASAATLSQYCQGVIAVLAPGQEQRQALLAQHPSMTILTNPDSHLGMGASLAAAAHYLLSHQPTPTPKGVFVALADMPWISADCYQRLGAALQKHPIVAPIYQGQRGHPVGFQWSFLAELSQLTGDQGARSILKHHGFYPVPVHDAGVCADVDRPEQLKGPML